MSFSFMFEMTTYNFNLLLGWRCGLHADWTNLIQCAHRAIRDYDHERRCDFIISLKKFCIYINFRCKFFKLVNKNKFCYIHNILNTHLRMTRLFREIIILLYSNYNLIYLSIFFTCNFMLVKFSQELLCELNFYRYFYFTILREPVARYLSEFAHVRRGATWDTAFSYCNNKKRPMPKCYDGLFYFVICFKIIFYFARIRKGLCLNVSRVF